MPAFALLCAMIIMTGVGLDRWENAAWGKELDPEKCADWERAEELIETAGLVTRREDRLGWGVLKVEVVDLIE